MPAIWKKALRKKCVGKYGEDVGDLFSRPRK
jgi:hypothetical protein